MALPTFQELLAIIRSKYPDMNEDDVWELAIETCDDPYEDLPGYPNQT